MVHLPRSASVQEAQEASGLSFLEFKFYKKIAKAQAEECVRDYPDTFWGAYKPVQQKQVADSINAKLAEQNIHPVREDVIDWKMHNVIRDVIRARDKRRKQNPASPTAVTETAVNDKTTQPSTATRDFDPIRNI